MYRALLGSDAFLKKLEVCLGRVLISQLGKSGLRCKRASTDRTAFLETDTPLFVDGAGQLNEGMEPLQVTDCAQASIVSASVSLVPFQCFPKIPQQRSIGMHSL